MGVFHKGVELNQQQLDAITPIMTAHMNGAHRGKKKFHAAIDKALADAGCPVEAPVESNDAPDKTA